MYSFHFYLFFMYLVWYNKNNNEDDRIRHIYSAYGATTYRTYASVVINVDILDIIILAYHREVSLCWVSLCCLVDFGFVNLWVCEFVILVYAIYFKKERFCPTTSGLVHIILKLVHFYFVSWKLSSARFMAALAEY